MMTPTKNRIFEEAKRLFFQHQIRSGQPTTSNPLYEELRESGFISVAQSNLMSNKETLYGLTKTKMLKSEKILKSQAFHIDVTEALKSGVYVSGTTGSGKSDLAMYVSDMLKEHAIIVVFDPSLDWINRSSISETWTPQRPSDSKYFIPCQHIIYDLSKLKIEEQKLLVENFCELLWNVQINIPEFRRRNYFIIFEEAHSYFPEGQLMAKAFQNTRRVLTMGRNADIRIGMITQFSSMIDKKAMRYMKQRYFGFTDEPNDVEYVSSMFNREDRNDVETSLRNLEAGKFIYKFGSQVKTVTIEPYVKTATKTRLTPIPSYEATIKQSQTQKRIKRPHKKKSQSTFKAMSDLLQILSLMVFCVMVVLMFV